MENQYTDEKLKHDIATITAGDGVDEAANRCVIGSGEQMAKANGLDIDPETGRKKKKIEDELIKLSTTDAWDSLMDDIAEKIREIYESRERQNRLNDAIKNQDLSAIQQILVDTYNQDADQFGVMTLEEATTTANEFIDQESFTQDSLTQDLYDLRDEYDQKHGLTEEQKTFIQDLYHKANISDLSIGISEIRGDPENQFGNELDRTIENIERQKLEKSLEDGISDPFNIAANNDALDPFALEQEKNAPNPFSVRHLLRLTPLVDLNLISQQ
ncbi:MAG: hypothetical protein AAF600_17725 [Bacteroidota bacterium]